MGARYIVGDVFDVLATLEPASVDLVMTSPPFLALRSYLPADHPDKAREIGSEATPGEFIDRMLDVVEACARVLAPHGSLVFELGDTYAGSGGAGGDYNVDGWRENQPTFQGSGLVNRGRKRAELGIEPPERHARGAGWPLDKSKVLIPQLFAIALAYGFNPLTGRQTEPWRVRNTVAWCRPNPPVGRDGDKFRSATSFLTVACKARDRYWDGDAVRVPSDKTGGSTNFHPHDGRDARGYEELGGRPNTGANPAGAPLLDWWEIPTAPYKGSHYACVDEATEALTPSGWKRHDDLADGDLIAAYDTQTDRVRWERAKFVRYDIDDELVAIEKEQTSQRLTMEHRMLVRTRKRPEPFVKLAGEVTSGHDLMLSAPWALPEGEGPGSVLAALLGWTIAEGSIRQGSRQVYIYQSLTANPQHCDRIRDLLTASGAKFDERLRVRTTSWGDGTELVFVVSGETADWLRSFPRKMIPAEAVFEWPETDARAMFDALVDGDGHRRKSDGRISFIQKDRDCADWFQTLALRLGHRAVVQERPDGGHVVYVSENRWVTLRGADGWRAPVPREHYQGVVWCPQVATTFWLARRSGKPFITGNTYPPDLVVPIVKSMCPSRVCRVCGKPSTRITGEVEYVGDGKLSDAWRHGRFGDAPESGDRRSTSGTLSRAAETLGWSDCGHDDWRPGIVLDPFAGSGTTLSVATGHGLDAIGIDLDERNADLARERVGMFLAVEHHEPVA